MMPGGMEYIQC